MANRDYVLSATLELKDKLTGKLNDARKGLEGVKGSAAAASGALDGVGTSAVKAAAGTGRLKSALSGVKGTYQATVGVKDEASGKLSAIKNGVRELAGRASAVTVRMRDEASGKLTRIKEELAGLTGKTYTAMVNVKQNGGLSKLKEGMSGFAGGMLMNTPMQMAGAAGIGFGMYDALKTYSNFESEISGIKALTNMSGEQMAMVRDKAKELGAATRYSSVEAAQGMSELLKAGIDVKDVMGDASQAALDLASAGDLALPEAASVMSTAMNAFHMDDATHVADILAGAANASATDVHELSYALSAVSAVAAGAGMSFDDTNTALAVFAQNGLKGSDAGTSLKTMLANLSPKTDTAMKAFQRLNLIGEDGNSIFYDSAGNMKSLADIASILQERLGGLTSMEQQDALYQLFGSDAIRGGTILMKEGADGVRKMQEEMTKFTAASVAAEKMNNLKGSIYELQSAADNLKIDLFEGKGGEGIRSFVQEGTKLIRNFSSRIKEDGLGVKSIMETVGEAVGDLKNKFIEFDGVGSLLAGGVLAAGLYKVINLAKKAMSAVKGLAGMRKGGAIPGQSGASSVGEMVVNAATVIVNGKSIAGGGVSSGKNSGGVIFGPDGRPIQSGGRTQAPAPQPGRAAVLRANAKALGGAGALAAIFGAMDIYSAKSQNSALLEEAAWGVKQASENIEELTKNGGSQEQWRSALDEYTKANDYRAQVEHDNRMREGDAIGGALGSTVGTVLGGVIGSFAGPTGTVIGMTAGGILGEIAGKRIGSWLSDYNIQNTVSFEKIAEWLHPKEQAPIGFDLNGKTVPVDIVGDSIGIKDTTKDASSPFGLQTDLSAIGPHAFDTPRDTSQDFGITEMQNMYTTGMFGGVQEEAQEAASASADAFSEASASISTDFENTGAQATATADNIQMDMLGSAQGSQDAWSSFPSWYDASVAVPTSDAAAECSADVSDSFETSASDTQGAWSGVGGFFSGLFASIKSGAASCAASVAQSMASAAASARAGGHTNIAAGLDWIGNNAAWLGGVSYPHNAIGTSFAPGGWTEINEHGGEIVDLPTGSRVYPHATTLSMLKDTFENNLPTAIPVSAPSVSVDLPRTQSDAEATQVVITGNSFIVREEADIDKIAYKLLTLMQESRANMNPVEGVFA